jgi:hypothetical protein
VIRVDPGIQPLAERELGARRKKFGGDDGTAGLEGGEEIWILQLRIEN